MIDNVDTSASVPAPTPTEGAPDSGNVPTIVPTPKPDGANVSPQPSAIEQASRAAREKLATGVSNMVEDDPAVVKPKPRDGQGKFKPGEKIGDPGDGTVGDSTKSGAPDDGQAAETDEVAETEGQEPVEAKVPAEAKPGEKPDPAAEGAEGEPGAEGEDEGFTVELSGRREGEKVSIIVDDEETANVLKMHENSFKRRQQLEGEQRQVQEMRRDYEELQDIMAADPAGFALETFAEDPATAERVALTLLSDERVWNKVKDRLLRWEDPDVLDAERTKIENQNLKAKERLRGEIEEQRAVSKNLKDVQVSVAALIPPDMAEDEQAIFYRDSLRDLKEYADRNNRITLDIADIPLILASTGRLKAHKIDPLSAADKIQEARSSTRRPAAAGEKPPATSATAPVKAKPAGSPPPPKTGQQMVKGSRARRAAASSPAGAGSPSSAVTPPPNQSIAERLEWHRKQASKARTLTR